MSFEDQVITTYEERLVFLDKSGSGVVQYLVLHPPAHKKQRRKASNASVASSGGGNQADDSRDSSSKINNGSGGDGGGGGDSGGGGVSSNSSGKGLKRGGNHQAIASSDDSESDYSDDGDGGNDDDDDDVSGSDAGVAENEHEASLTTPASSLEIRNYKLKSLGTAAAQLRNVHEFAACEFNNRLYVTGGYHVSDLQHRARTWQFDPESGKWREVSPMQKARAKHAMVVYNGRIVVAGGETLNGKITSSCEAYDTVADKWSEFAPLPAQRCWLSCTTFRNELYASGGFCGGRGHDNLWIYEEKLKAWNHLDIHFPIRLPHFVDRHLMVELGDTLYFFGGVEYSKTEAVGDNPRVLTRSITNGYRPPKMVDDNEEIDSRYPDRQRRQQQQLLDSVTPWVYGLPDMWHARHSAAHLSLGDTLYLFGGTNNDYKSSVTATDLFSCRTGTWSEEGTLRGDNIGNPVCAKLTFSEKKIVRRALPRSWPLW